MRRMIFLAPLLVIGLWMGTPAARAQDALTRGFRNPPASARPHTWWHWINGNISQEGITADLEAMKKAGIGGAQVFNVDVGVPAGKTPFMSPQWRAAFTHAAREANRLGIELCLHNCAGWSSSGGPWITPQHAMQILTWSETPVRGPMRFAGKLPQPETRLNFYRDIAVFAVRRPEKETAGSALRIADIRFKAAFERGGTILPDRAPTPEGKATPLSGVIVLENRLAPDGTLAWEVPNGDWTLIRLGHTPTGKDNHPSPEAGRGLECDKMSREAMDVHWNAAVAPLLKDIGPLAGRTLNNALIDSYEVGSQNWTAKFREEFRGRRGYDPLPYLPTVTGRVVESIEISERFLWDFRRTISDLFADNYFGYFAELCRKNGMLYSVEPYGNGSFDNLQVGGMADVPMGEFWIGGAAAETAKLAASAAHTNGRKFVGAEAFTADDRSGRWLVEPAGIKALGDRIFSYGVNRYIFHRYAHQPWADLRPGMTMGPWGMHLERTLTWWDQGAAWLRYVARSQYLLQAGRFAADVLVFTGDSGPNDLPWLRGNFVPNGFDYDGCDATVLEKARMENGAITLPSGMRYRVLVLPDTPWMTAKTLRKVRALVEEGAVVLGPKPDRSPGLSEYPRCDVEIQRLAAPVWGNTDGKTATEHAFGKGRVYWGKPLAAVLTTLKVAPDFAVVGTPQAPLNWIHCIAGGGDFYFVANPRPRAVAVDAAFRVAGKQPELWHPETGRIEAAPVWREEDGRTVVSLRLGPAESAFVVFRQAARGDHAVSVVSARAAQQPAPRLEIVQAFYEATDGAGGADVTEKVRAILATGETLIPASNATFGDPTVNHVKRLRVIYTLDGKRFERTAGENDLLDLGGDGSETDRPAFEITSGANGPELRAWTPGVYEVKTAAGRNLRLTAPQSQALTVSTPWTLRFAPNLGAPPQVSLPKLLSWTEHAEPGIRYFSGSATYETTFDAPASLFGKDRALYLDLGKVKNFAEVTLNGKPLPTLWKAPFRQEVTGLLKPGKNLLTVRVTNLWPNRLIGDEQQPDEVQWNGDAIAAWPEWLREGRPRPQTNRIAFTTWRFWRKDSPLLESGLLGPVTVTAVPKLALTGTRP